MWSELIPKLPFIVVIAIVSGVAVVACFLLICVVLNRVTIAFECRPKKLVRQFFNEQYPNRTICHITLSAEEESRWVVGVFYGNMRPPQYEFYEVDRRTEAISELTDCSSYAPRNWR